MNKFIIILFCLGLSSAYGDTYVLPNEIKMLARQVVRSFIQLELNMWTRYLELKGKPTLTEAEFEEFAAYKQIFFNDNTYPLLPLTKP